MSRVETLNGFYLYQNLLFNKKIDPKRGVKSHPLEFNIDRLLPGNPVALASELCSEDHLVD